MRQEGDTGWVGWGRGRGWWEGDIPYNNRKLFSDQGNRVCSCQPFLENVVIKMLITG